MYFFIKLQFVCFLTLLLLIAELVLDHFTHSITLLVVAWQTLYNFISLFISSVSLALSHNNSKELQIKVILTKLITNSWVCILFYNAKICLFAWTFLVSFLEYLWVETSWCSWNNVQYYIFGSPLLRHSCWGLANHCTQWSFRCDASTSVYLHSCRYRFSCLVLCFPMDWRIYIPSKDCDWRIMAKKSSSLSLPESPRVKRRSAKKKIFFRWSKTWFSKLVKRPYTVLYFDSYMFDGIFNWPKRLSKCT